MEKLVQDAPYLAIILVLIGIMMAGVIRDGIRGLMGTRSISDELVHHYCELIKKNWAELDCTTDPVQREKLQKHIKLLYRMASYSLASSD